MKRFLPVVFLLAFAVPAQEKHETPPVKCPEDFKPVFASGERLTFGLYWGVIKGAESEFRIEDTADADGNPAFRISNRTETTPFFSGLHKVDNRIVSTVSREYFRTLEYRDRITEGKNDSATETVFDYGKLKAAETFRDFVKSRTKEKETDINQCVMDAMTAFYWSRHLDLKPGDRQIVWVYAEAKVYPVELVGTGYEMLDTPFGEVKCIKIEPRMEYSPEGFFKKEGKLWFWLTCDERRIPVRIRSKIKVGSITARLLAYDPGKGSDGGNGND